MRSYLYIFYPIDTIMSHTSHNTPLMSPFLKFVLFTSPVVEFLVAYNTKECNKKRYACLIFWLQDFYCCQFNSILDICLFTEKIRNSLCSHEIDSIMKICMPVKCTILIRGKIVAFWHSGSFI